MELPVGYPHWRTSKTPYECSTYYAVYLEYCSILYPVSCTNATSTRYQVPGRVSVKCWTPWGACSQQNDDHIWWSFIIACGGERLKQSAVSAIDHDNHSCDAFSTVDPTGDVSGIITTIKCDSYASSKQVGSPTVCCFDGRNAFVRFGSRRRNLYPKDHDQGVGSLCDKPDTIGNTDWSLRGRILDTVSSRSEVLEHPKKQTRWSEMASVTECTQSGLQWGLSVWHGWQHIHGRGRYRY